MKSRWSGLRLTAGASHRAKTAFEALKVEAVTKVSVVEGLVDFSTFRLSDANFSDLPRDQLRSVIDDVALAWRHSRRKTKMTVSVVLSGPERARYNLPVKLRQRSEQRRRRIVAHHTKSFADADAWDLEFWQRQTPEARPLPTPPACRGSTCIRPGAVVGGGRSAADCSRRSRACEASDDSSPKHPRRSCRASWHRLSTRSRNGS